MVDDTNMADDTPTFENPIIRGFNPDPTICVVPATQSTPTTYFLCTSTFEYFPSCPIYTSTDLINWKLIGHALTRRSQIEMRTVEPGAGSWASTLRYRPSQKRWFLANGVFQRYRPSSDERIFPRGFYVYTDNIWDDSAWSDPVYFDNPGFDQDLFWDYDDKVYLSTTMRIIDRRPGSKLKDFGIHISEIELSTGRTLTPPKVIRESPHGIAEGSHILRRGAYYYLFTAEGGTEAGHQEWVFRSREGVFGPWAAQGQPLWYNGPNEGVQRTGHADVFEDDKGDWWAVLLGVRPTKDASGEFIEPQMGRETFLVKVDWLDDWPVFNEGRNITLTTNGRRFTEQAVTQFTSGKSKSKLEEVKWKADLDREDLELGWYQKNTPLKACYSLTQKPGCLRLYGNCYHLGSPEAPAMLLRKQSSYFERFEVKMRFDPSSSRYEAGVVLWWSQYSHATCSLVLKKNPSGKLVRTIKWQVPGGTPGSYRTHYPFFDAQDVDPMIPDDMDIFAPEGADTMDTFAAPDEVITMRIEADDDWYVLYALTKDHMARARINSSDLTVMPSIGGAFCGAMFGIYSFGVGEPVLDPADFFDISISDFKYGEQCI
ncbi:glycoside hydrolase family 43 protein [Xylariaceae sp. FL1019]|nr:glycoside hydrolase family 43 protein [Xylariaceae sp. FL1019]